ncbi:MAG TPA: type II secretion system F family protein [Candidatus Thermoplasmatota archaeon]|nr:type II secretion system F family protein [Candidatus Thermoplasmatota archaeon]
MRFEARHLSFAALALAALSAALAIPAATRPFVALALLLTVGAAVASAMLLRARPPAVPDEPEDDDARFSREVRLHVFSAIATFVVLLFALVDIVAAIAGAGFVTLFAGPVLAIYPIILAVVATIPAIAGFFATREPRSMGAMPSGARLYAAWALLGLTGLSLLLGALIGLGILDAAGMGFIKAERAPFVSTVGVVTGGLFALHWLGFPGWGRVIHWMEAEERIRRSNVTRQMVIGFVALSGVLIVASLVASFAFPDTMHRVWLLGFAMLALIPATFSVGISHVVLKLEVGLGDIEDVRKKRRVILQSLSVGLTVTAAALGVITFLAFLAQAGGAALFRSLLEVYTSPTLYPFILTLALVPLLLTLVTRTRVQTEVQYTDRKKALSVWFSTLSIVLIFFGVFAGSGLASGKGISEENAVLVLSLATIVLSVLVKTRALLPGVVQMILEAIKRTENANEELAEDIRKRMMATYVGGLVFVLAFVGFVAMQATGVVKMEKGPQTDLVFFLFLFVGLGVLIVVGMRYFQGVNIDPRWKKATDQEIGKKRLTSEQMNRYLVLGVSMTLAGILFVLGLLVQFGLVTQLGPLAIGSKYATDFFVFAILLGLGPYGFYHNREMARIRAIDQKFPEFLRDLAESQRSGMTLTEAVITASKGSYGALTPDIKRMASQIEWGISFEEALKRFAKRVRTPLIERTVSLVVQASKAGGNVVDVLAAAADDSREIQMILKERKSSMSIYVMIIYIAFFVFIGVIGVLNAQFIPEVSRAVKGASGVTIGGLTFRAFDEEVFKTLFFHGAIVQGLGGGIVAGVMEGGKPISGLKHAFVMITIAYVVFRLVIG